jgi:phage I-like protein
MSAATQLALCSALAIDSANGTEAPEWLHLLPAGEVRTQDKRGPYRVKDVQALMAASLKDGGKLVLDENHSTDLAAPKGGEAPARGWIVELQARNDGIWGRVEWTPRGRELVANREYRGISPVIAHLKDKTIVAIRRASLVNQPNLEGLTALHSEENGMDLKSMLVEALGLGEDASDEAIVAAVKKAMGGSSSAEEATQAALAPVLEKLGITEPDDIAGAIDELQAARKPDSEVVTALQSELANVTTQLNALRDGVARREAEAFVDAAIAEGRVGVKPMRDEYVAMHMEDADRAKKLINAMPSIKGSGGRDRAEIKRSTDLDDADRGVIALMGLDAEEFKKTRAAEAGETEETL